MSGICGIYHLDGSSAPASGLAAMMAATPFRGPDGEGAWQEGPIALGHQLLATTPESVGEGQPLRDEGAGLTIVFDGRIDNRDELRAGLSLHRQPGGVITDAQLVLQAYRLRGSECCARLLGDFAFVIWDAKARRLFAARDRFGIRPFYYCMEGDRFACGSEKCQLLQLPWVPRRVNEGMVAEYLSRRIASKSETLFRDIRRLPPAHTLCIEEGTLDISPYWEHSPRQALGYRHREEYVEHFLEILRQSVSDRLRCIGRPGLYLSGGLDSSAVAGMAQTVLNDHGAEWPLDAYSITLDPASCVDELPCMESVVAKWGLGFNRSHFTGVGEPDWLGQVRDSLDLPDFPTITMGQPLRERAADSGIKVLLTGAGADSLVGGGVYPYQDFFSVGDYGAIASELRSQAADSGWSKAMSRLCRSLAWPLLPRSGRARLEATRRRSPTASFLCPDFARRIDLESRLHRDDSCGRFANLGHWEYWRHCNRGDVPWGFELEDRAEAQSGLEQRHPFYDLRLVEFASALPGHMRSRGGENKLLLLQSGLLPERVRQAPAQAEFTIAIHSAIRSRMVADTLSDLSLARRGWVDQRRVDAAMREVNAPFAKLNMSQCVQTISLWWIFALELWIDAARLDA